MKKEIYTICFDNESSLKQAIELLENNNFDFYHSVFSINKTKPIENIVERQDTDFKKAFETYLNITPSQRIKNYGVSKGLSRHGVVPHSRLKQNLRLRNSFKYDIENNLNETIKRMINCGYIKEISKEESVSKYGTSSTIYKLCETDTKKQESDTRLIPAFDATLVEPIF